MHMCTADGSLISKASRRSHYQLVHGVIKILCLRCGNDPSAASPTETLLRLHLPINYKDWKVLVARYQ